MKDFVIYGASGHGKVIADILETRNRKIAAFIDDDPTLWETEFFGYPVWSGIKALLEAAKEKDFLVIAAIGNNDIRRRVVEKLIKAGIQFGTAVHPSVQIGKGVTIEEGSVVMANAVINPDTVIGSHCIINTAATVDHDNRIGDFVHLSPGAHTGGGVTIGNDSWIGLGVSVINNLTIGENVVIGAGSVVIRDVESNAVMIGNPAKTLKKNE